MDESKRAGPQERQCVVNRVIKKLGYFVTALGIRLGIIKHDRRWHSSDSLLASWSTRTEAMAKLITKPSTVLELGCGNMALEKLLPAGSCYIPSDLVYRGYGTLVFDLNDSYLPVFPTCDICFMAGVLEYVKDVHRLVEHLSRCCDEVIVSYCVGGLRLANGWVNSYKRNEIVAIFNKAGYRNTFIDKWNDKTVLFRFSKETD